MQNRRSREACRASRPAPPATTAELTLTSELLKRRSVRAWRSTAYASGDSSRRHSASLRRTCRKGGHAGVGAHQRRRRQNCRNSSELCVAGALPAGAPPHLALPWSIFVSCCRPRPNGGDARHHGRQGRTAARGRALGGLTAGSGSKRRRAAANGGRCCATCRRLRCLRAARRAFVPALCGPQRGAAKRAGGAHRRRDGRPR